MSEGILKFPVGNEYKEILSERPADVVNYSDSTLAKTLEKISSGKIPHVETVETAEKTEKDLSGNILTDFYLTLNNAEMTGTPTAPEYDGTDTAVNQIATCGYFNGLVRKVAGSTDVTVAKIIAALNGDPNFATTTAGKIDAKQSKNTNLTALNKLGSETGIILATSSETLISSPISTVGKKVLGSSDFENFRGIIQAPTAETFLWDETEKVVWQKVGSPYLSTDNARFNKALQCSAGNYVQPKETITLGGQDFTIDLWAYVKGLTTLAGGYYFFYYGDIGIGWWNGIYAYVGSSSNSKIDANLSHIEFCYSHNAGRVYIFQHGILKANCSFTFSRAARTLRLGQNMSGAISEFRILDGVCLHTGNFSPPTAPYELTDETVSLLHFDKSY